jgi:hypothetical protein
MRVLIFAACLFAGFVSNINFAIYVTALAILFMLLFCLDFGQSKDISPPSEPPAGAGKKAPNLPSTPDKS